MGDIVELKKNAVKEVLKEFLQMEDEIESVVVIANLKNDSTKIGMTKLKPSDLCFASKILDRIILEEINELYQDYKED